MKKVTKLESMYDEIDKKYRDATPEQMEEAIKKLQEELEKNKGILAKMETAPAEKKEPFERSVKDLEKRITNMKGYSKYKGQIHKIQDYKAKLTSKQQEEKAKKAQCEETLKKAFPELQEVVKLLKDEKYTMELDQDQYNGLLQKRVDLLKKVEESRDGKYLAEKRITELQAKISKCDLAWKTLFVDKDWEEIQKRALSDKKRFTRKVDEKHPPLKEAKAQKMSKEESAIDEETREEIAQNVKGIMEEQKAEKAKGEENLPAPVSKWAKFKNWFRNIPKRIKAAFDGTEKQEEQEEQKNDKKDERDQFLEGLRKYADEDYKIKVNKEKEKAYVEAHKAKPEEEKTSEER